MLTKNKVWWALIICAGFGFLVPAFMFRQFQFRFFAAQIAFYFFQYLAMRNSETKERLFKYLEYLYYLVITGVIALGARYILNSPKMHMLNELLERNSIEKRIEYLEIEIPRLPEFLADAKAELLKLDKNILHFCGSDNFQKEQRKILERMEKKNKFGPPKAEISDCGAYTLLHSKAEENVRELNNKSRDFPLELRTDKERLKELKSRKGPPKIIPTQDDLELEFIRIPFWILIGISIKVGKVTCSLWQYNENAQTPHA